MAVPIDVVGIGADGWGGLAGTARAVVQAADVVFGSARQLESVPVAGARKHVWPSPLLPTLRSSIDEFDGRRVCVLASGDPMFHGIGVTLAREFGAARLRVIPAPSSLSLACARLGWAVQTTTTVSLVDSPVDSLRPALADGVKILVLSRGRDTPASVVGVLRDAGFGRSRVTVLERLGADTERSVSATADTWTEPAGDPLNVVAIECISSAELRLTRVPGLPDAAFGGDGQLTKAEVRSLTLSALAPSPGEMLWDVGGGSGSIAIEWMRTDPRCRAVAFESLDRRRAQIESNASALGVPALRCLGTAPASFPDVTEDPKFAPDAIFVGGGLTRSGMIDACWDHVRPGGRIVANAVTAESEAALLGCVSRWGGTLRKFQIYRAEPLGSFTGWRPHLPVAQWVVVKP
ncbi:precorrin-6y C5,15-methyltransferase (decarboxylating) subunit CbiE [Rhodococcoides yunnanense]|uniref:precorrin-6y C5,15-methyltransferase (decarboxylating) subunit CbiE n=1 Tax=Rhodococcoides yunnanense TaxID=278209 RepID=UPI0009338FF0|nr:precorrin-6y C5,15-methyltransferase (decarboxylating) subunit CbiE [Rhodococcus yunnanensis]